jgi:hypothetical protein
MKKHMPEKNDLDLAKINARQQINSISPEEAQQIVNDVIYADMWQPDVSKAVDWDDSIPVPRSWINDVEENS